MSKITGLKPDIAELQERSAVCRTLMGGTRAMRDAGKTYLPIWPQESEEAWTARKNCSALFPGFKKALQTMVGRPFETPVGVGDDVPAKIEATFENIDLAGRDLDQFARDVFTAMLRDGLTWVLADYPTIPEGSTAADEVAMGAQPYLVHIPLENMISYRLELVAGKHQVVHARWFECSDEFDGKWGTKEVKRIRVWEPGLVQLWEERKSELTGVTDWALIAEGVVSLQEVPIVCFYGDRTGFWQGQPPLEDLAWLNVQHWQSASDQRHVLHVARVPLLGADLDNRANQAEPVALGPGGIVTGFTNLRYIEHTGAAIEAGRTDLLDLEDQMKRVAGELLTREVQKTATETGQEASEGASWLRRLAFNFQDGFEECLRLMAAWVGEAGGGTISLDTDWDEETLASDIMAALTAARTAGQISKETYLWNLKEGGVLPPDRTIEQELDALDTEGMAAMPNVQPLAAPKPRTATITKADGTTLKATME